MNQQPCGTEKLKLTLSRVFHRRHGTTRQPSGIAKCSARLGSSRRDCCVISWASRGRTHPAHPTASDPFDPSPNQPTSYQKRTRFRLERIQKYIIRSIKFLIPNLMRDLWRWSLHFGRMPKTAVFWHVIIDADSRNKVTDLFPNSFLFKINTTSSPMCRCCLARRIRRALLILFS